MIKVNVNWFLTLLLSEEQRHCIATGTCLFDDYIAIVGWAK